MRDHLANFTYKTDPIYRQTYDTKRNPIGNEIADHSGVVAAAPVGAAPTTSSFAT